MAPTILCFTFTRPTLDPMWVIDWVQLVPKPHCRFESSCRGSLRIQETSLGIRQASAELNFRERFHRASECTLPLLVNAKHLRVVRLEAAVFVEFELVIAVDRIFNWRSHGDIRSQRRVEGEQRVERCRFERGS